MHLGGILAEDPEKEWKYLPSWTPAQLASRGRLDAEGLATKHRAGSEFCHP